MVKEEIVTIKGRDSKYVRLVGNIVSAATTPFHYFSAKTAMHNV